MGHEHREESVGKCALGRSGFVAPQDSLLGGIYSNGV